MLEHSAKRHTNPPSWTMKQRQDHVRKLFWAFFGAASRFARTRRSATRGNARVRPVHSYGANGWALRRRTPRGVSESRALRFRRNKPCGFDQPRDGAAWHGPYF